MILIPAIDLKDGQCVRLLRGDFATAHQVADDPAAAAHTFRAEGAEWLHVVDLDGAKAARPENEENIFRIKAAFGRNIEVGGGIRNLETLERYLQHGISRVVLGTAALQHPEFVQKAVQQYGGRIAVGIDAKKGMAAQEGWKHISSISYLEMAKKMEQIGVKYIIFTDISRDGTLSGPNLNMLDALNNAVSCKIIASGGISSLKDVSDLLDLGVYGAICGKALYSGNFSLQEGLALCAKGNNHD